MTFLMLVQAPVLASPQFQLDASLERRAAAGREQLELLKRDAASSPCWEAALSKLETGCRVLDDETQSRLAIAFTNCHLAKSGLPTYACTDAMTVEACTAPMAASTSGLAFSSYTTFFTHAESMCFYLQSEAFQRATEHAVDALHASALASPTLCWAPEPQRSEWLGGGEAPPPPPPRKILPAPPRATATRAAGGLKTRTFSVSRKPS